MLKKKSKAKYRRCKICRKKVERDYDMLGIVFADKKDKRNGWYHLSCNGSIWALPLKEYESRIRRRGKRHNNRV